MEHVITTATSADLRGRAPGVAVLPIGSFEQHGAFLPLATDTIIACLIADRVARDYDLFLLPPITLSCSHEHSGFAGTVSLSPATLIAVVEDVARSLRASGIHRLVLVNGHGGNYVLSNVVQAANIGQPCMTLFPSRADWDAARAAARMQTTATEDMHGGEFEVSLLLHACPDLVGPGRRDGDWLASPRPHLLITGVRGYSESGIIGRPSLAAPEKGRAAIDSLACSFKEHLDHLG
jgi:creatinine amidohydrolase